MRFLMLMRKELRESLPWILLVGIGLLAVGGLMLRMETRVDRYGWKYSQLSPGAPVSTHYLTHHSVLTLPGAWLFVASIGLGLVLGVRHFWIPHFTRTWPFLLHRSVSRKSILAAKLTAGTIAFVISLGTVWVALYWYANRPEVFAIPPTVRVFIEGWIFIMLGLVAYLGTALSGLSTANWYTTKTFGLVLATVIIVTTLSQWTLAGIFTSIAVSVAILLSQIFDTFLRREF